MASNTIQVAVFASFLALFFSARLIAAAQVKIAQGTLEGVVSRSRNGTIFHSFFAIPYAKPPIGQLRFEPPVDAEPWEGVRDAKTDPPICMQSSFSFKNAALKPPIKGQEDCLYLNVHTTNITASPLLPVMVYIHGGAFHSGSTGSIGPEYLMDHPVVVVSMQYRLHIFGFLSAVDEIIPGNYGMKDQVAALKWVQKNIATFGGDPKRVTLVGESAGAAAVHFHLHSPLSTGLFHQAIMQSGSALGLWAVTKSKSARNRARVVGVLNACPELESKALVECLKKVPAEQLVETHNKFFIHDLLPSTSFTPVVEPQTVPNAFLTRNPWNQAPVNGVPVIFGVNKDEGGTTATRIRSFPTELDRWNRYFDQRCSSSFYHNDATNSSEISAAIRKFYFGDADVNEKTGGKLSEMFMDGLMLSCSLEAARQHNNKVFFYLYAHRNKHSYNEHYGNITEDLGVCHTDDLLSLFNLHGAFPPVTEGPDLAVSQRFVNHWINFIRTGDPNGEDKQWKPMGQNFEYLHMMTDSEKMETKLFYDRYNFWMNVRSYP